MVRLGKGTRVTYIILSAIFFAVFISIFAVSSVNVSAAYTDCGSHTEESNCVNEAECSWEEMNDYCAVDCWAGYYDETSCTDAYNGTVCLWDSDHNVCDPSDMNKSWDGFSPCFDFDGNQTGCGEMSDQCSWFPESNCGSSTMMCWDESGGGNHGICNPNNFDFGGDYSCPQFDGNRTGCDDAKDNLGWTCEWMSDAYCYGDMQCYDSEGTEHGWCNDMFGGGGGSGGGCWDYYDNQSCTSASDMGMPCQWQEESSSGWCMEKGCWNYFDSSTCQANAEEGCEWNSEYTYCYEIGCWDLNQSSCTNAETDYDLDCGWQGTADNGWCEENGCWKRDWTNQTYCEEKDGCNWDSGNSMCNMQGCWEFDDDGEDVCNNKSATGRDCFWDTGSWGWCEQKGCWDYDYTNQTDCENVTAAMGMDCTWDAGSDLCFEDIKGCSDYSDDEFGCYGTGWCFWNPNDDTCNEPVGPQMSFFNPGCWVFDEAGESKCENVSTCNWNSGSSICDDGGADANNGVQCNDIINSEMCNNIPMLSSCCKWNGTGCMDAPFSTACWDNMQEPPAGAHFCDDYNAKNSKSTCEQIMGDPWYMPCLWNATLEECMFEFDNMFGDAGGEYEFENIGSKANCEALGGMWKSEKWTDPSNGAIYTDEWCEMGFGMGKETCNDMCWACELQNNGTAWPSQEDARGACEQSVSGCTFHADTNSFNNYGWCDKDFQKVGNCDQNCWDCWDAGQCSESLTGCKWFVDPYNSDFGWCDDKNVKTCEDDCYMCWDQDNCMNSAASCTWDTTNWFCTTQGSGEGGESSEICFDGVDNDADNFIDCGDPECMFDSFCGGSAVFGSNCPSIQNQDMCENQSCIWITDKWDNSWCDMEGSQCWLYDDNQTACGEENGCNYNNMSNMGFGGDMFCDVNFTLTDEAQCWNYDNNTCGDYAADGCIWTEDMWCQDNPSDPWCLDNPNSGWCDYKLWSCWNYDNNQTACDEVEYCGWEVDNFNPDMSWCAPVCFSLNESTCDSSSYCEEFDSDGFGWCEPENMFKGCWDYFDSGSCGGDAACTWVDDPFMPSGGFCSDMFMYDMVGGMDQSPPHEIAWESCSSGANEQSDLCFIGIKDDPDNYGFGAGVMSMGNAAVCSKFGEGGDNRTTKFYFYLDSDDSQSGGCSPDDDPGLEGFEFKFKYEAAMANAQLSETKVSYKCLDGNWSASQIKVNAWPDKMCYGLIGGMVAVSKEDLSKLKALNLFDEGADMRVYVTTATDGEYNTSSNPYDTIGPAWYSPYSADFKFEDCEGFTDKDGDGLLPEDDPDCGNFLRYGYIEMEEGMECNDGFDNDGNGLTDCADYGCMYDTYFCSAVVSDNKAPEITWMKSEEFMDGAFIDISTNEPTNASLYFYKNDSYCSNISDAITILDWKLENDFTLDDYDFWHGLPVDNYYFNEKSIVYTINNNDTYYYKVKLCDPSGNCALSACSSFTTTVEEKEFVVGFKLPPPGADPTSPLGNVNVQFDWGASGSYDDSITGSAGKKINDTKGKKVNFKLTNPNATDSWEIDFMGAQFKSAQSINVSDSVIVNESIEGNTFVGIKKNKWEEMAQKLGIDYVKIVIPQGVSDTSRGRVKHCPDDATSIEDSRCVVIDLDDVNCTFSGTNTVCEVPTSIGFSVFAVYMVSAATPPGDSGSSGSSSGSSSSGGGGSESMVYVITADQLKEGYTKKLRVGDKIEFPIDGKDHHLTIESKTATSARVSVASEIKYATLEVGQGSKFEVSGDNYLDVLVSLEGITDTRAEITMKIIHEEIVEEEVVAEEVVEETVTESGKGFQIMLLVAGALVLSIVMFLLLKKKPETHASHAEHTHHTPA